VSAAVGEDVASIRAARTHLNVALVSRDLAGISKYWLQESQSVFAGGEVKVGRPEIMARYAAIFQGGNFISGLRIPERIEVATGGPREDAESGHWEWRMRQSGQELFYRGRYLAMWRKVGGRWLLRSDLIFTRLCGDTHSRVKISFALFESQESRSMQASPIETRSAPGGCQGATESVSTRGHRWIQCT
jgi:ketosteroid isomerase-like protein